MREAIMQAVGAMSLGARGVCDLFQTGISQDMGDSPKYRMVSNLLVILPYGNQWFWGPPILRNNLRNAHLDPFGISVDMRPVCLGYLKNGLRPPILMV